ncbi:MAG: tyrosine-type recombinase/integrase [Clostridiales bacterium]|nr:tyrosine-type recombinase/integrase [Clostridiales bacterium]MCF8022377.1 tyrosine-type recombinase/integrase [Clostridiales bacterium]
MSFHDLRHTFATLLLVAGEHPKVVQELLGHSKINVTMDIYTHVGDGLKEQAANRINDILNTKKKSAQQDG